MIREYCILGTRRIRVHNIMLCILYSNGSSRNHVLTLAVIFIFLYNNSYIIETERDSTDSLIIVISYYKYLNKNLVSFTALWPYGFRDFESTSSLNYNL